MPASPLSVATFAGFDVVNFYFVVWEPVVAVFALVVCPLLFDETFSLCPTMVCSVLAGTFFAAPSALFAL